MRCQQLAYIIQKITNVNWFDSLTNVGHFQEQITITEISNPKSIFVN